MNFRLLMTVLYEIATNMLSRVYLKENPGLVGLVLQQDTFAGTVQIHWGVDNGKPVQTWHNVLDVVPVSLVQKEYENLKRSTNGRI